ncbi:hypothetical protein BCONGLO52_09160 [Brachybacterium conglomeratum]|uniref:Uncharacterized protein n=1 Tax=Brachybacterium conglomeratum TaxID=47846 RepID=A0ABQ5RE13_9MICO|nr:hypothetical protein BCONGLO52_09160 [Brachybacterium conglomeratum]GLK04613.1 hypothetical protein GCM10017597_14130 [Brachybacterium conglomeratum]
MQEKILELLSIHRDYVIGHLGSVLAVRVIGRGPGRPTVLTSTVHSREADPPGAALQGEREGARAA